MQILRRKLSLSHDAASVYAHLCDAGNMAHTALLETCEVGRPEHAQSFSFCSAALQISGRDEDIIIRALNANGQALLATLPSEFTGYDTQSRDAQHLHLSRQSLANEQDEAKRLQQPSVLTVVNAIRAELQARLSAHNADARELMFFGAMRFDLVDQFETLPSVDKTDDDVTFFLADQYVLQNHRMHHAKVVTIQFGEHACASAQHVLQELLAKIDSLASLPPLEEGSAPKNSDELSNIEVAETEAAENEVAAANIDDAGYIEYVKNAKARIVAGDIFQVVLSRQFALPCADAFASYRELRQRNPSPYLYFVKFGDKQLFGASPESALKVNASREVTIYPIAGTRPRGKSAEHDARIEFELIQDEKENAEHMMLVDLARNDIARIAKMNSRKVSQLKNVVKYSQVMHIVSEVSATLRGDLDSLSAYRACANMGTLTGAPKIEAMHIIRDCEQAPRGLYGGAVCVYFGDDSFDSAIIIRSAVVQNDQAIVTAGAGIVHDSDPQAEADETRHKARAVIAAIATQNPKGYGEDNDD